MMAKRGWIVMGAVLVSTGLAWQAHAEEKVPVGRGVRQDRSGKPGERREAIHQHGEPLRAQIQEQRQAQMEEQRAARAALRKALQQETDPYKQVDLLHAHLSERQKAQQALATSQQEARLAAFGASLAEREVPMEKREQMLGQMLARHEEQARKGGAIMAALQAELSELKENPDLTVEEVQKAMHAAWQSMGERRQAAVGERQRAQEDRGPQQRRERPRRDRQQKAE